MPRNDSASADSDDKKINTEFEEHDGPLDNGVEREFVATEEYDFQGEQIERETTVALLEDGGVHVHQKLVNQNAIDSLTLSESVVEKIVREREDDD